MLNKEEISTIISQITYKPGWRILLQEDTRMFVQIEATTLDSITHLPTTWKSGKRYLSEFMCRNEIVNTVYSLIEHAEIHECREFFRYKGSSIYNPHIDPDVLAEVTKKASAFNMRENPMSMKEANA